MRIGFVPLDDRPCTKDFARKIAGILGERLLLPPETMLGHFVQPGDADAILDWIDDVASQLDVLVLSLDMLAYGGLVASRAICGTTLVEATSRLSRLRSVKKRHPSLMIVGSNVIMRLSITAASEQTHRFWEWLHEYNVISSRLADGSVEPEVEAAELRTRLTELQSLLPPRLREEYDAVRRRNHAVNRLAVELAAEGILDFVSLCQEDADIFGPHINEQRSLADLARTLGVTGRVRIYPGADEAGMVLMARVLLGAYGTGTPVKAGFLCLPPSGAGNVAAFEDRPVGETLFAQAESIGLIPEFVDMQKLEGNGTANHPPDLVFWVNCPANEELVREEESVIIEQHQAAIRQLLSGEAGKRTSVVGALDVRRPNGGDEGFVRTILETIPLSCLTAYAGWNTAGNSIGTGLAQAVTAWLADKRGMTGWKRRNLAFLWERFTDDWLYQRLVRPELTQFVTEELKGDTMHLSREHFDDVSSLLRKRLPFLSREQYRGMVAKQGFAASELPRDVSVHCWLPWERLFEVGVNVDAE